MMQRLLRIQLLCILDIEPEEIHQLRSTIDLCLPGVLALAQHGRGHDLVAVFARDEVRGFEEDGGAVGEGEGFPGGLCGEGGGDGGGDVGGGGVGVGGDGGGVVGGVLLG